MEHDVNAELETQRKLIAEQAEMLKRQAAMIEKLEHQLDLLLRQRYGRKSDKIDPSRTISLRHGPCRAGDGRFVQFGKQQLDRER
jgi:hypothetical protein